MRRIFVALLVLELGCSIGKQSKTLESDSEAQPRADDPCDGPQIQIVGIAVPSKASRRVQLKYERIFPKDPAAPTIIYLPGGPGGNSIGDRENRYPEEYGFIHTDPRGVGCNDGHFPEESFTTEQLANDLIAIITGAKVDNYIVYGHSFGTMLATIFVAKIESSKIPKPRYVVLEGVLGRVFRNMDDATSGTLKQWHLTKEAIPSAIRENIDRNIFPFQLSSEQFGSNMGKLLSAGTMNGEYLPVAILEKAASDDLEARETARSYLTAPVRVPQSKLAQVITCQEIAPTTNALMRVVDGNIMISESEFCHGYAFNPKFDGGDYQIKSKIYYFNGDRDPATPPSLMTHHFDSQKFGDKVAISVPEAGHVPLLFSLAECMPNLWRAMTASRDEELAAMASECVDGVTVSRK